MIDTNSPYYPYANVQESYENMSDASGILRRICDYLLDAPTGDYVPKDDNSFPRCRFWKYLYYDTAKPLSKPLPSIKQKMQVLFNPEKPTTPPTALGYRLIPQIYVQQSQEIAQTRVHVFLGRTVPSQDELKVSVSVVFYIWTHYSYELNTKEDAYSRALEIEFALWKAFHGVNMAGIGTFLFSKRSHPDCGSRPIMDGQTNIGRELTLSLELASTAPQGIGDTSNMPFFTNDGIIRLA